MHNLSHPRRHLALDQGRTISQSLADLHFIDHRLQLFFEPQGKGRHVIFRNPFIIKLNLLLFLIFCLPIFELLILLHFLIAGFYIDKLILVFILLYSLEDHFIDMERDEDDGNVALFERFVIW